VPESAGALRRTPTSQAFGPESKGAFRESRVISTRHVEVARQLAVSEAMPPLEKMRVRLEALMSLDMESRKRHKISDAEVREAEEIYGVVIAFLSKQELFIAGHLANTVPFSVSVSKEKSNGKELPSIEEDVNRAFSRWLPWTAVDDVLYWSAHGMPPETAYRLQTLFVRKTMPWLMNLTARVSDSIGLEEWESASTKVNVVTP
jgi:hypothetical protein